jgi:hypothetical protein
MICKQYIILALNISFTLMLAGAISGYFLDGDDFPPTNLACKFELFA